MLGHQSRLRTHIINTLNAGDLNANEKFFKIIAPLWDFSVEKGRWLQLICKYFNKKKIIKVSESAIAILPETTSLNKVQKLITSQVEDRENG